MQATEILSRFLGSPAAAAIAADVMRERVAARAVLVAEIEQTKAAELATLPDLDKRHAAAVAALHKVAPQYQAALQAVAELEAERNAVSHAAAHRVASLEMELRRGADPAISEFQAEMDRLEDRVRHTVFVSATAEHVPFGPSIKRGTTNARGVCEILQAIREARAAAEAMKLGAVEDIPAALDALRASIPTEARVTTFGPE